MSIQQNRLLRIAIRAALRQQIKLNTANALISIAFRDCFVVPGEIVAEVAAPIEEDKDITAAHIDQVIADLRSQQSVITTQARVEQPANTRPAWCATAKVTTWWDGWPGDGLSDLLSDSTAVLDWSYADIGGTAQGGDTYFLFPQAEQSPLNDAYQCVLHIVFNPAQVQREEQALEALNELFSNDTTSWSPSSLLGQPIRLLHISAGAFASFGEAEEMTEEETATRYVEGDFLRLLLR